MAADFCIRILEDVTEEEVLEFLGPRFVDYEDRRELFYRIMRTPCVFVGQVSWLKAAISQAPETYIPEPIAMIDDLIGLSFPVIDDAFIEAVGRALEAPNTTTYHLNNPETVLAFLRKHKGKKCFALNE
jgi:hypothetical protein